MLPFSLEELSMFSRWPRCQVLPLDGNQVAFGVAGKERLRWHAAADAPRPFLFPLIGPSGLPLTRMGHPGAPDHDHHRSIWFAHHKVLGIDFWSDNTDAIIRQHQWLAYQDSDEAAQMAVELRWYDGHDPQALVKQEVIFSLAPDEHDGLFLEVQTSLTSFADSLELGQTNFGLFAVRVAKSISAAFGDGVLTGANGDQTEAKLFGKASPWMDYSGSVEVGVTEGITYFDHAQNGSYPSRWHVRDDGWMNASICRDAPVLLTRDRPTTWRYLLHAHAGGVNVQAAEKIARQFNARPLLVVGKGNRPHQRAAISRLS
ncbi:MAG: PmoA family protein [Pirellulales bacterium]|nr:PmoA family protein [Pirellulales bacterium]